MVVPRSLKKNDTIGIVAPGRKIKREELNAAFDILKHWGLQVKFADHLFSNAHAYLAGTDEERLEDFQRMLDDSGIAAIICARGGYGSTRILDDLNFDSLKTNPKWIVGFSDITAIHLKLFAEGVQSIHGIMPVLFSREASGHSVESLKKILFGDTVIIKSENDSHNRQGSCTGQTIGGNLSLLVETLGTTSEPDTKDKILIIEEVDEYRYRLDRMMIQLKRAGKLNHLAGLVIGHFTDIKDTELSFGETVEQIIMHAVSAYDYPVGFGFPTGHDYPNLAWRHGGTASLIINNQGGTLSYS